MSFSLPSDPQRIQPFLPGAISYWPYTHYSTIDLDNVTVSNNNCSFNGGGVSIGNGGRVTLSAMTITGNSAAQFAGGLQLGTLSPATCSAELSRHSIISGNVALGGAQVLSTCASSFVFEDTVVDMGTSVSQV